MELRPGRASVDSPLEVWPLSTSGVDMEELMTSEDHWYAHRIPDDFVAASGDSISRISRIVTENWWQHGADALAQLVEPLADILEPLASEDAVITNKQREQCTTAVQQWLTSQKVDL